jgi:hypothetical protein
MSAAYCARIGGRKAVAAGKGETVTDANAQDVLLILTQFELPPGFGQADLDELRHEVSASPVRTGIEVEPGSDERDPFTAAAVLFVIHFLSKHGMDIVLGVAEGAFWDGVKSTFSRLRRHKPVGAPPARVGVTYPDGRTVYVEASTPDELVAIVRKLGFANAGEG